MKNNTTTAMLSKITQTLLAGAVLLILGQSAQAATKTLNGAGTDGTWATGTNWNGNTAPASGDSLSFGATNNYNLNDNLTNASFNIQTITFTGGNAYTVTGATFTLLGGITNGTNNTETFNNTGGILSGSSPLTFTTNGTGNTVISGGLINNAAANLEITANGTGSGTLVLGTNGTTGLTLNNLVSSPGTVTVTIDGTKNVTILGNVVNGLSQAGLTYAGGGTLTLAGANTYTGTTTISSGTVKVTSTTTGLGTGDLALTGNSNLLLQNAAHGASISLPNNTFVTATTSITTDAGTAAGAGNTYTLGTLSIGGSTLNINAGPNSTSGTAGVTFGATSLTGTATFNLGHIAGSTTVLTLGSISNTAATGAFNVTGTGDLTLATASGSIASGTHVNVGNAANATVLNLNTAGVLGTGVADVATTEANAIVNINGNTSLQELTGANGTTNVTGTNTLTIANNIVANDTYGGTINGSGNLTISGSTVANAVTLSATNGITGTVTLASGRLNTNANDATGTGDLIIAAGTELDNTSGSAKTLTNSTQVWNSFTFGGTNNLDLGNGNITLASDTTVTNSGSALLQEEGSITGTQNLTINNTLGTAAAGTTIGNLASHLNITGSFSNVGQGVGITRVNSEIDGSGALNTATGSFVSVVENTGLTNGAGSVLLLNNGNNLYTGDTDILAGTVQTGAGFVLGLFNSKLVMTVNGTLDMFDGNGVAYNENVDSISGTGGTIQTSLTPTSASSGTISLTGGGIHSFGGIITGSGGLQIASVTGTGVQILTSSRSTYSGGTTFAPSINTGFGSGTIVVGNSSRFAGGGNGVSPTTQITSGPLGIGLVTVALSGTIATDGVGLGNFPGYQIGNNVTILGANTLTLTPTGTTGLWLSGLISGTGTLSIGGSAPVYLTGYDSTVNAPVYNGANIYGDTYFTSTNTVVIGTGAIANTTTSTPKTITSLGLGTVYVNANTTLTTDGASNNLLSGVVFDAFLNGLNTGNSYLIANNFVLDPSLTVNVPTGTSMTMTGQITSTGTDGGLIVNNPASLPAGNTGILILTGAGGDGTGNNYQGATLVEGGTLMAGTNSGTNPVTGAGLAFSPNSDVTLSNVGTGTTTLDLNGNNETIASLSNGDNAAHILVTSQGINNSAAANYATLTVDYAGSTQGNIGAIDHIVFGVSTGSIFNGNLSDAAVIPGAGALGLTVQDSLSGTIGVLTLGGNNNYYGDTTIASSGEIEANSANALSANSAFIVNGILDVRTSNTIGALTGSGTITNRGGQAATLTLDPVKNTTLPAVVTQIGGTSVTDRTVTTFSGLLTDGGNFGAPSLGLTLNNTNGGNIVLTLSGISSYHGATIISAGTKLVAGNATFGSGGGLSSFSAFTVNGTLDLSAVPVYGSIGSLAGSAGGIVNLGPGSTLQTGTDSTSTTFSGSLIGSGNLTKTGTGTQSLAGQNTYTGITDVSSGVLAIVGGSNGVATSSELEIDQTSTFDISGVTPTLGGTSVQLVNNLTGSFTDSTVVLGNNTLLVNTTSTATPTGTFEGIITGNGGLSTEGTSTLTLTNTQAYAGATTIGNFSTLALVKTSTLLGNPNPSIFSSSSVTIGHLGTLDITNAGAGNTVDVDINNLNSTLANISAAVFTGTNTLIVHTNTAETFSGQIFGTGTGGLTTTGTSVFTLTNTQQYVGQTDVDEGTLAISNVNGPTTGIAFSTLLTIDGTATFDISGGGNQSVQNLTSSSALSMVKLGANTLTDNITSNSSTTFAGTLTGTGGGLDVEGFRSTLFLTNTESYTGATTIGSFSTLALKSLGVPLPSIASSSSVTIGSYGALDITQGGNQQINKLISSFSSSVVLLGRNTLTINVNNSDNATFAGSISGSDTVSGSLVKTGTGTETLTGANSYGHGTLIAQGTLALAGNGSLNSLGRVHVDSGTFFDVSGIAIPGEAAFGSTTIGDLGGAGTTNLGNTNLITGGDSRGSIYSGVFTGTGTLTKEGSEFMVLSGASTNYFGDVVIQAGAQTGAPRFTGGLIVANSRALGNGSVDNESILSSEAFAAHFIGGPASEIPETITVGTNYTQANSTATGTLALEVVDNGYFTTAAAAGNAYDTLHANGLASINGGVIILNFAAGTSIAPGQRFQVISADAGPVTTDPVAVTVTGIGANPNLLAITSYNDSFGGSFANNNVVVTLLQPFNTFGQNLTSNQNSVANNVDNTVVNLLNHGVLMNPTGAAADFFNNIVGGLTTAANGGSLGYALDQLSPQRFQLLRNVAYDNNAFDVGSLDSEFARERNGPGGFDTAGFAFNDSRLGGQLSGIKSRLLAWSPQTQPGLLSDSSQSVLGGVAMADPKDVKNMTAPMGEYSKWNGFIDGGADLGSIDGNSDISNSSYTTGRIRVGGDYAVTNSLRVGAMFGYSHTDADLDNEGSKATVDSFTPGIFVTYADKSGFFANGIFTGTVNNYSTSRNVIIPGVNRTASGSTTGLQFGVDLDGGYEFHKGDWTFGPAAGLTYVNLGINSFSEGGANSADLAVNSQSSSSLRSRLGGSISYKGKIGSVNLTPHIDAFWQHEFLDNGGSITSQFVGLPGGSFSVNTTQGDKNNALVGIGLDADLNQHLTLFIDYQAEAGGSTFFGQSISGGAKVAF